MTKKGIGLANLGGPIRKFMTETRKIKGKKVTGKKKKLKKKN